MKSFSIKLELDSSGNAFEVFALEKTRGRSGEMKYASYSRHVDIVQEPEPELFALRRGYDELRDKFLQLEDAFRINLRIQKQLERELELNTRTKAQDELNKSSFKEIEDESLKARTELFSTMMKIRMENERWREAFMHQKRAAEKEKLAHERTIATIREECEVILKTCRESGEKHFRKLLELCEDSRQKLQSMEDALKTSQVRECSTRGRILELANLLDTLEKFQGVRIQVLCERTSEALTSLANKSDETYEESMKKLRHVIWDVGEKNENPETLDFLKAQNSVLREVVKGLKKKLHKFREISESKEFPKTIQLSYNTDENFAGVEVRRKKFQESQMSMKNAIISLTEEEENEPVKDVDSSIMGMKKQLSKKKDGKFEQTSFCAETLSSLANEMVRDTVDSLEGSKQTVKRDRISNRMYVEVQESHRNGIPYEEYTMNFFNGREFRIRNSSALTTKNEILVLEFVDSEKDFEEAPVDRMVFYLGDNVERIDRFKKASVHCAVQTMRVKILEKFVQTNVTGTNGFSKINGGVGILNSERRALERSLDNLERTVASLKENVLGHAHSLIGKDVNILGNEFFECVKRLEA